MTQAYQLTFLFLLCGFKYPIDGIGGSGVRADDIVASILILTYLMAGRVSIPRVIRPILLFSVASCLSSIISAYLNPGYSLLQGLLFSLRHVEYLAFFILGQNLSWTFFKRALLGFGFLQAAVVSAQLNGLLNFATAFNTLERAAGTTGGPWELAAMITAPIFIALHQKKFVTTLVYVATLLSTSARITIISFSFMLPFLLRGFRATTKVIALVAAPLLISVSVLKSDTIGELNFVSRIITSGENLPTQSFIKFKDFSPGEISPQAFSQQDYSSIKGNFGSASGDISAFSRFSRWSLALKFYQEASVIQKVFGLGPSFFGVALDGNYIRIFVTTGFAGGFIFLFHLLVLYQHFRKHCLVLLPFFLMLTLTALFIDIFFALKANVLIWAAVGVTMKRVDHENTFLSTK